MGTSSGSRFQASQASFWSTLTPPLSSVFLHRPQKEEIENERGRKGGREEDRRANNSFLEEGYHRRGECCSEKRLESYSKNKPRSSPPFKGREKGGRRRGRRRGARECSPRFRVWGAAGPSPSNSLCLESVDFFSVIKSLLYFYCLY